MPSRSNIFAPIVSTNHAAPTNATRWMLVGWGLYVASMFLPAMREWLISPDGGVGLGDYLTGFECWLSSLLSPYVPLQIAVSLPPLVYRERLFHPPQRGLWGLYVLAFLGTLAVPIFESTHLGIGYYCWSASFLALARGFWLLPASEMQSVQSRDREGADCGVDDRPVSVS